VPQLKAKRLRALAITSAKRSALMPDIPAFAEAGLPGYDVTGWYGVVTRTGVPKEVIARVHVDTSRVMAQPDVVQTLASFGLEAAPANTPEEFGAFLRAEIGKWAKVVKTAGAKAD